jgi:hypothetical protein
MLNFLFGALRSWFISILHIACTDKQLVLIPNIYPNMYTYKAFNLGIHSELLLPELIPSQRAADVTIRFGKLNERKQHTNGDNYLLGEIEGFGKLLVQRGREIILDPHPVADESVLRPFILGAIMSILLRQRGLLVLHASSVVINDVAVAFMGESGWGKSTLAESFHAQGYSILTDDLMAIQLDSQQPLVIPSFPQIKLWPDAAASFGHAPDSLPLLNPETQKLVHQLSDRFFETPVPLKRLYVLAFGTHTEITPMQTQESFVELVRHSREVQALTSPEFLNAHIQQCSTTIKQVPIYRLQRQRSLAALPDLVKLIKNDITLTPCHA